MDRWPQSGRSAEPNLEEESRGELLPEKAETTITILQESTKNIHELCSELPDLEEISTSVWVISPGISWFLSQIVSGCDDLHLSVSSGLKEPEKAHQLTGPGTSQARGKWSHNHPHFPRRKLWSP